MNEPLAVTVRCHLLAFARSEITPEELWRWLIEHVSATQADVGDVEVASITRPALLFFYEFQAGHRTIEELRSLLLQVARSYHGAAAFNTAVVPVVNTKGNPEIIRGHQAVDSMQSARLRSSIELQSAHFEIRSATVRA